MEQRQVAHMSEPTQWEATPTVHPHILTSVVSAWGFKSLILAKTI